MKTHHQAFDNELAAARNAYAKGDVKGAFARLERAHIVGQLSFGDHIVSHLWMLKVALKERDGREVFGQVLRLAATVPGHLFGWLPIGNTGGANVSPLKPMPIPADLAPYFEGVSLSRQILRQTVLVGGLAVAGVAIWAIATQG